jgi:D-alanyl-D-alanine-carboxypeptidase/D-alanyl-D-alanine-endopeptidase
MSTQRIISISTFALLTFLYIPISAQSDFFAAFDATAQSYVNSSKNKGLVIAIIDGKQLKIKGYGQLSKKNKAVPDAHTIFEIGAITEVFTTTLMVTSSQHGSFDTGDPIQEYLPDRFQSPDFQEMKCVEILMPGDPGSPLPKRILTCSPDPLGEQTCIAFCDLATHTSGLSSGPKDIFSWSPFMDARRSKIVKQDYSKEDLYQMLHDAQLRHAPGTNFHYSNFGTALLGHIISDAQNLTYEALLQQTITTPLQLKNTKMTLTKAQQSRLAPGHNQRGRSVKHTQFDGMAPAAGLYSTAQDLAQFIKANIQTSNTTLADAFEQAQQARLDVQFPGLKLPTEAGYGWLITKLSAKSNQPVIWHSGGTEGFRAFVGFVKDTRKGVVLLSNSANPVDQIGFKILRLMHGKNK